MHPHLEKIFDILLRLSWYCTFLLSGKLILQNNTQIDSSIETCVVLTVPIAKIIKSESTPQVLKMGYLKNTSSSFTLKLY